MKICVIGLGPVGLSILAASLYNKHYVIGIDLDQEVIEKHKRKIEGGEDINVREYEILNNDSDNLLLTCEYDKDLLKKIDAFFICVNTEAVIPALEYLDDFRSDEATVLIESTVYPAMIPPIERILGDKLIVSPERIMEGKLLANLYGYKKIVGARSEEVYKKAEEIYMAIGLKRYMLEGYTPEEAAMSKIAENGYRYWTITYGHVLADIVRGTPNCDYENVRKAINTRPDRELPYSGLGIGGICLEENVDYLIRQAMMVKAEPEELEMKLNFEYQRMINLIPNLVKTALNNRDSKILVMGAAYRPDGQSVINSPSVHVYRGIKRWNNKTYIYDSGVEEQEWILTKGLPEIMVDKEIDTVILALDSKKLVQEFLATISKYPKLTYINLTQLKIKHPKNAKYMWIPC